MLFNKYDIKNYKLGLVLLTVLLTGLGILVLGSAESSVQLTQLLGLLLGLFVMVVVSLFDYQWILKFNWLSYGGCIVLLLAVILFGDTSGGAQRWIDLGFIRFQPSELCKILLILFFAQFFYQFKDELNTVKTLGISVGLIALPLLLILKQPDLSTTVVVALVFCSMIFMAGLHRKIIWTILAVAIPLFVVLMIIVIQPGQKLLEDYQQNRILAWLYPDEYSTEEAMQQQNSMMAIGSGRISGKGLNNDEVDSLKNGNFVPEPQTDFIFAVVGEELGFVGCSAIIILLFLIVMNILAIGRHAKDGAGELICVGVASLIGLQSTVNICVATGLLPNTGVTLPFVSYGLTSLVSLFIGIGLVLNVGLQPGRYDRWETRNDYWLS